MKKMYVLTDGFDIFARGTLDECKEKYLQMHKKAFGTFPMEIYEVSKVITIKNEYHRSRENSFNWDWY